MSLWKDMKDLVNGMKIDEEITRNQLLKKLKEHDNFKKHTTVDMYRNALTHAGVLEVKSRGVYIKKKHIRPKLTITELRDIAYHYTWKSWFVQVDQ